jgi:Na+/melibiose symporter-like transporter
MSPQHLNATTKLLYGVGQSAEGIKTAAFAIFVLFYYHQVLGLSGTLTGLAVGIALAFDAITDPLVGSLSDRWQSSKGRRHPFMYAAIVPFSISLYLLFLPPVGLSEIGLFLWLTTFAVLTRGGMTLFHVPHIALGAELSSDFDERTTIVSYRIFFSTLGALTVVALGFGVFFADTNGEGGQFDVSQYPVFAGTLSLIIVFVMVTCTLGTQKFCARLYQPEFHQQRWWVAGLLGQMTADFRNALGNRSFRGLFFGILATAVMIGVDASLSLHMNSFFWELSSAQNMPFFIATPVGQLLGVLFTRRLGLLFDKKPLVLWGTGCWLACQITPILLRFLEAFPANGTPELLWVLVSFKLLQGLILAQVIVSFNSMVADVADEHQMESGERNEGIFFAALGFSGKVTSGLGSVASGVALDLISWPKGSAVRSASDVPAETIAALGLVYGPAIAIFGLVSMWCYSFHNLNRTRHREIQAELQRRKYAGERRAG